MSTKGAPVIQELYVLRESYYLLATRILVLEIVVFALLVGLRIGLNFVEDVSSISLTPFYLGISALAHVVNICAIILMVLQWTAQTYMIKPKELQVRTGIFNSKTVSYDLSALQAITLLQNWLGKLFNYGTVRLYNPVLKEDIYLNNIHNPEKYVEIIKEYEKAGLGIIPRFRPRH